MARFQPLRYLSAALLLLATGSTARAADGLAFGGAAFDGTGSVNGLRGAQSVAISPDGADVYVAGGGDGAIAVFRRGASGAPVFVEQQRQSITGAQGLGGAADVAVSRDGANVYAAGTADDSIVVFSRDAATGGLTFTGHLRNDVDGVTGLAAPAAVTVAPNGATVYVASSNALAVFARDAASGDLSFVEAEAEPGNAARGLKGAHGVAVSPDSAHVYVAGSGDNALGVFAVDSASGGLVFVEAQRENQNGVSGLAGANAVAVSPDGAHVYVAGKLDDAIAVFSRDTTTGALTFVEVDRHGFGGVDGLDGVEALAVAPDGLHLYAASSVANALAVFARDPASGSLTFLYRQIDGLGDVAGLGGAAAVAVTPDSTGVWVASKTENAVAAFDARCGDGNLDAGEQCDDGNAVAGDGCSPGCRRECTSPADCDDGDVCTEERCRGGECALPRCGYDGGMCELIDAGSALQATPDCGPLRGALARTVRAQLRAARIQIRIAKHQGVCLKHAKHHGPCIQYTKNPTAKDLAKLMKQVKASLMTVEDRAAVLAKHGRITPECQAAIDATVGGLSTDLKTMVLHKGVCAP